MTDAAPHLQPVAPPDASQLESWIAKAAANPFHIPAMWREMKSAELHVIVPCEPDVSGEFVYGEGDALSVVTLEDGRESYAPVFTTLEQAEAAADDLGAGYGVASADAAVLFVMLADAGHHVVIDPFSSHRLKLSPKFVHELATTGHVNWQRPDEAYDSTRLVPVPARDIPHDYLLTLRGLCVKRRALTGLYLFHPIKEGFQEPNLTDYRFLLRLHQRNDAFFKEFSDVANRALPAGMIVNCFMVTDNQPETLAFLDRTRPIWPV